MKKKLSFILSISLCALLLMGATGLVSAQVELELFQNKQEAVETYDALIEKFEAENPDIDIVQNYVPEAETVLKTRLVKNDIPDIMAIGGNYTYGELARAGVLTDLSSKAFIDNIQDAYRKMINDLEGNMDGIYGVPFSANANTVLYNKDKFAELGLEIPETWDEFIENCDQIKANGGTPIYLTFKDAWTAMVPFNTLAANLQGENFIEKKKDGETTFAAQYREVAEKMLKILEYGHVDNFGVGYNDGNRSFAKGESFMLIQGIWAIGPIKEINPDLNLGVFNLPVHNEPSKNLLVSGVDSVLAVSESTKNKDAALKFIKFLLKEENAKYYIDQEKLYSAVKGVYQEDSKLVGIRKYFETGRITSFPDHYYPAGMQVPNLVQEFLIKKDIDAFLNTLDNEWNKVSSR